MTWILGTFNVADSATLKFLRSVSYSIFKILFGPAALHVIIAKCWICTVKLPPDWTIHNNKLTNYFRYFSGPRATNQLSSNKWRFGDLNRDPMNDSRTFECNNSMVIWAQNTSVHWVAISVSLILCIFKKCNPKNTSHILLSESYKKIL